MLHGGRRITGDRPRGYGSDKANRLRDAVATIVGLRSWSGDGVGWKHCRRCSGGAGRGGRKLPTTDGQAWRMVTSSGVLHSMCVQVLPRAAVIIPCLHLRSTLHLSNRRPSLSEAVVGQASTSRLDPTARVPPSLPISPVPTRLQPVQSRSQGQLQIPPTLPPGSCCNPNPWGSHGTRHKSYVRLPQGLDGAGATTARHR